VNAAQIPPFFINSVVALGEEQLQQAEHLGEAPHMEWSTEGTGFFYGYLIKDDPNPEKKLYEVYLVTAKHVVKLHEKAYHSDTNTLSIDLNIRLNGRDHSNVQQFSIGDEAWFFHPNSNVDIALAPVNFDLLHGKDFFPDFFQNDQHVADIDKLKNLEVTAGDGIFVLGFPMNLAGKQRNYVIVRNGIIARLGEMLDHASDKFMIDGFVFPGNSGGPVVLRPEATAITGTKSQSTAYLIGVVINYQEYIDTAISPQTGRARVTFEENSGLSEVLPTDFIDEAIKAKHEKMKSARSTNP
jgi:hypothetical protein